MGCGCLWQGQNLWPIPNYSNAHCSAILEGNYKTTTCVWRHTKPKRKTENVGKTLAASVKRETANISGLRSFISPDWVRSADVFPLRTLKYQLGFYDNPVVSWALLLTLAF